MFIYDLYRLKGKRSNKSFNVYFISGKSLASGDSEGVVNIWQLSNTVAPDIFKSIDDDEPDNVEIWNVVKRFRYIISVCMS